MEIRTRKEAQALGLTRYFTGKACKRGHVAERSAHTRQCRLCSRAKDREYHHRNKEKRNKRSSEYAKQNRSAHNERNRKWAEENKEKIRAKNSKYAQIAKDKLNEKAKRWRTKNPEKARAAVDAHRRRNLHADAARAAKRRAGIDRATPSWLTAEHHSQIVAIYNLADRLSKQTGVKYHVDHIMPLNGKHVRGLHVPWNLQVLTADENLRKNNKVGHPACPSKSLPTPWFPATNSQRGP